MAVMTLLCGIPGAGKTTWAQTRQPPLGVQLSDIRPCRDWFIRERARRRHGAAHLSAGVPIVVDGCNLTASVRSDWRRTAHLNQAACHLVVFDIPAAVALARNRQRPNPVDDQAMHSYIARWPSALTAALNERWDRVSVIRSELTTAEADTDAAPAAEGPQEAPAAPLRQSMDW